MMAMMGMLPMIASMAGSSSPAAGFAIHLLISAVIGVGFALLVGVLNRENTAGLPLGLAYGAAWWVLGPLTLLPFMMGMGLGVNWTASAATAAMPSLVGHLIFGGVLGALYHRLQHGGAAAKARPRTA
jgi:uncharacterized membrane protein YagU involved in acid resistance